MSQSAPHSRLSKTNPADTENSRAGPSIHRSLKQPLTERSDVTLRQEAVEIGDHAMPAKSWRDVTREWRRWYEESSETQAVFENQDGDRVTGSDPNRFHPDYGDKQYAKLKDLERGIQADYGRRLHTAMLTLTASSTDADGEPLPPADHLDELLSAYSAVTRELRRSLDSRRYERLAILEPHKSGYIHIHIAVFVEGVVRKETFESVIDAHVRNCDLAEREAHDLEDDSTVSVRWAGGDRDGGDDDHLDELAIYLAEYLGTYGDDPLDQPDHVQAANALLWATQRQRWRPSNGAQEYMATNRSEPSPEWELVGVEDGEGEIHDVSGASGGVPTLDTWIPGEPPPGG